VLARPAPPAQKVLRVLPAHKALLANKGLPAHRGPRARVVKVGQR